MVSAFASLLLAGMALIALSPMIPPGADNFCEQTALCPRCVSAGQSLCGLDTGASLNRTYSSQILLAARRLVDNVTAVDRTFGAQPFLRPDMVIFGEGKRSTFLSTAEGLATGYFDFFICSEELCESVADLKYFQSTRGEMGVGYPLGIVPFTNLAVGLPLGQGGALVSSANVSVDLTAAERAKGITRAVRSYSVQQEAVPCLRYPEVAVAGVRVVFEMLTDFMLSEPGLGVSNRMIEGGCTFLLYPDSAWYRQYIIGQLPPCAKPVQSFAMTGLSNGSWCQYCDPTTFSVVMKYQQECFVVNQGSCGFFNYTRLTPKVGGWVLNMYNLTIPSSGETNYSNPRAIYAHPWTELLLKIVSEGRSDAPAGCNQTDSSYTCIGNGCSTDAPPSSLNCPAATVASDSSGGFGALLSGLEYRWACSLSSSTGSFLGYSELIVDDLDRIVSAAESWGYETVSGVVQNMVLYLDQVLSVTGFATTWLTSLVAIVGAWAAFPQISDFLIKALGDRLWGRQRVVGKLLAGTTTMVATLAPFVLVLASQHSLNKNNERRAQRSYFQAAYNAPGIGAYKLVVIAQVDAHARISNSALSLGLPLLVILLVFDLMAWFVSERVMVRTANLSQGLERLDSL